MRTVTLLAYINSFLMLILVITGITKRYPKLIKNLKTSTKKLLRSLHRYSGYALLITGIGHGYLALGAFRYHPGYILYSLIVLNISFILLFKKTKKKVLLKIHQYFPVFIVSMLILHYLSMNFII